MDPTPMVSSMTTFISSIGEVLNGAVGWIGTIVGCITSTPALMVPFGLGIGFTAVHLFKALR